ncbi:MULTISPECIES: NAD-dependent epimerase/dehydratase family protein [Enterococcus]|nr:MULTISPECIES: NAD(P)-dependent oxidoreductase [Enterococcus]MBU5368237.1 NAD(P)-dependent oxidoreductase [Enterococcus avium]MDO7799175.1 NAD(P)-dependent oxidoreductase [Enterococcus avium]MDT2421957.1 NAD(P)-dependent oxidoreductase [Enterococcus avium]
MNLLKNEIYLNSIDYALTEFQELFNKFKNKTIMVTGATGLIGSTIIDLLLVANERFDLAATICALSRDEKKIIKRFESIYSLANFNAVQYDANDALNIDLKGTVDFVIHAASNASPNLYNDFPVETMKSNFLGMMNILELVRQQKEEDTKVVYVSSSEVYGHITGTLPLKEEDTGEVDILNPRSSYASSKRATETLCASYYKEFGVKTVIVRPGHIYGPSAKESDKRVSSLFVRKAIEGENIVMKSNGTQIRSYTYSLDCAIAILFSMAFGTPGQAYNISNVNSIITIKEMAETIARATNTKVLYDIATSKETANFNPMENASLDSQKLEKLGWFGLFNAEQGFKNTIDILSRS